MNEITVNDVMTRSVWTASPETPFRELVQLMTEKNVSGLPIVDTDLRLVGLVTEADLVARANATSRARPGRLDWLLHRGTSADAAERSEDLRARDVMTPAFESEDDRAMQRRILVWVTPQTTVREATRILVDAGVKRLPVVEGNRRCVGIVSRQDLLRPFLRRDADIMREVLHDVILETMLIDPRQMSIEVRNGVVHLAGRVGTESQRRILESFVRRVYGVVGVLNEIAFAVADRDVHPEPVAR